MVEARNLFFNKNILSDQQKYTYTENKQVPQIDNNQVMSTTYNN